MPETTTCTNSQDVECLVFLSPPTSTVSFLSSSQALVRRRRSNPGACSGRTAAMAVEDCEESSVSSELASASSGRGFELVQRVLRNANKLPTVSWPMACTCARAQRTTNNSASKGESREYHQDFIAFILVVDRLLVPPPLYPTMVSNTHGRHYVVDASLSQQSTPIKMGKAPEWTSTSMLGEAACADKGYTKKTQVSYRGRFHLSALSFSEEALPKR